MTTFSIYTTSVNYTYTISAIMRDVVYADVVYAQQMRELKHCLHPSRLSRENRLKLARQENSTELENIVPKLQEIRTESL